MNEPNPKIVGSVLIGCAIVGAAYVLSNFGQVQRPITGGGQVAAITTAGPGPARPAITVVDSNDDGIEDWREEFLSANPVVIDPTNASTYTPPDSVTGQVALNFFQDTLQTRGYGPFAPTQEEIIAETIAAIEPAAKDQIIDTNSAIIIETTDTTIYTYANAIMQVVIDNNQPDLPSDLVMLETLLADPGNQTLQSQLASKGEAYHRMRDMTLNVPVPDRFLKEHLDLANSYNAVARNIDAMAESMQDPIVSLMRVKRFEDDATGLWLSFQNLFLALEPHAGLFTADDPAVLLVAFSPNLQ